ncbi:C40 family peptidase [Enterococcus faecium]|uniref:C40 family peptidase n=4 Tax=Enterococcus faecium TaxID=1352 RepID=UPI000C2750AE|nr:C40 family peptidase [Enterococcus faecium]EMF0546573.1 C40 family peptidase [Enterococcus faecium]PJO84272.1 peptidoglycan endopeptidase [Enterococcus faecium]RXA60749.1 peptidoglycan endopeptidase [Enterococcus faecium]TBV29739.1 peptidoglycan endopeptidase [Enterococcus faecium]TBV47018.1 peptidoglycan endopeptidase [Enterococcus faecium]
MKKKLLTLFLVMSFSIVLSVYYNTIIFSEQINYREEQYNIEREKALKVGYSEEQFKQIMEIPTNLSNENSETRIVNYTMTSNQTKVINKAMEQIGKPYEWGASGPTSFDCGGLVKYVYKQAVNIELPMGTTNQEQYGTEVSLNSLKPGDLLFYGNRGATYHVGIYKGNGVMIHAPQPGETVKEVNIQYFYPSFAKRILPDEPDYPYIDYNKMVTVTKAWSIWNDLQFSHEIKKAIIGDNYKIGKVYTNPENNNKYGEILVSNKVYGYINFDAVKELTSVQINRYLTSKDSGQPIWGNLECTISKGQTTKDKIYFVKGAYNLGDGKYLYSIYKDQDSSEWLGYLKAHVSLAYTPIEEINKNVTVTKNWSIWNNLQREKEIEKPQIGSVFSARLKLTNVSNNAVYYKLYKSGKFYGYINAEAVKDLTTTKLNKYVTFSVNNEDFWSSLDVNYSKGKTERGRVFYISISYNTADNQPIYSVYTDETCTEWRGYYKGNNFEDTQITMLENKSVKVTKSGYTVWGDLNFWTKSGISNTGDIYTTDRKFYNFTNNAYYYELKKDGKVYGYINSEAAVEMN